MPYYRAALDQLLAVTKQWLVISSLFTEFDIDARIDVIDYSRQDGIREPQYYCVYSLSPVSTILRGLEKLAWSRVVRSKSTSTCLRRDRVRGTYTRTLSDGRRLQFSGPLCLPGRFIAMERVSSEGAMKY